MLWEPYGFATCDRMGCQQGPHVNKLNCTSDTARDRKISSEALGLVVNMIVLWNTTLQPSSLFAKDIARHRKT